jgi:hypothetical protein
VPHARAAVFGQLLALARFGDGDNHQRAPDDEKEGRENRPQRPEDCRHRIARPNIEDIYERFKKNCHTGDRDDATSELMRSLNALDERVKQQEAERRRVGYSQAAKRQEAAMDAYFAVEKEIDRHLNASVLALGVVIMISLDREDGEDRTLAIYRATLATSRPALIDVIAEDADLALAAAETERRLA